MAGRPVICPPARGGARTILRGSSPPGHRESDHQSQAYPGLQQAGGQRGPGGGGGVGDQQVVMCKRRCRAFLGWPLPGSGSPRMSTPGPGAIAVPSGERPVEQ
jgi:hypothetical protein